MIGELEDESDEDEETATESMDTNVVKEYYDKKIKGLYTLRNGNFLLCKLQNT